ncbi:chemotaxis protein CheA [Chromobacterium violaceum]|uniref:Chemotaxis protein CheA n=18 Tax=Chromobacterium violaceum TaxID=536 RepID=Q7NSH6_CHRVO|nr:chemotaxis protein CheA [Chromobacterium violaceum]AAQ61111.1 probable chemotaxis protein CheA [Chromobacterium violaceum ATCC 12472]MBP4045213.1 chemotaxis protein CheA [Chromobacterium violaceum]MBP4048342.1 chemotaxis protein CheA [Chromobacterium violaceum]MCD0492114.1 chemotaxis protein CheA [Chromobacterium violaceum]OQS10622.1 chemotaxis protein CheA [Chromobacterium violaceum]
MSEFGGMEELLQDFLMESTDLLSDVDNKLVELEKRPEDKALLNDIFRGFHTIKGGAGFLNVIPMVNLCHRTENLFDKLRNGEMHITPEVMDVILDATGIVRDMFGTLGQGLMPGDADARVLAALDAALAGEPVAAEVHHAEPAAAPAAVAEAAPAPAGNGPDWNQLYQAVTPNAAAAPASAAPAPAAQAPRAEPAPAPAQPPAPAAAPKPPAPKPAPSKPSGGGGPVASGPQENTIRIDTVRLDMVLNLSGEIGLTKNRLTTLRTEILQGNRDTNTLRSLDEAISQLDLLVGDLQNAVMKTRMQPIGRLFQKYPRLARDLARQLGKEVELVLSGEETELDKTMIEDLNDPLVHLVRNAVDHGIESPEDRIASGKKPQALVQLTAEQVGDHILIEITDDGKGMNPDALRRKAIEKGLIDQETANSLDEKQCLQLIFLPGFSTKDQISSVSGRGVGMDVVRTNIQKLNGRIDISSVPGEGTRISISLPLTLAILPVLVVRACNQPFAVPLAMVREIITIDGSAIQEVSGKPTIVVRDEILPLKTLAGLLGWEPTQKPYFGVLMQSAEKSFILAIDSFVGRDDVVIKPLQNIRPKGVAGATLSGDGSVVLVLDMEDLLASSESNNTQTRTTDMIAT